MLKILRKNEYMVRQNDKTNHIGFVVSGIFRLTRIDTNGNEWIVGYSFENDFVCDYPSLINREVQQLAYRQQMIAKFICSLWANLISFGEQI
ncbi:cyclic nucleotide-binding domain-containing protein [Bacteroides rodentium]|uniref:cyclic nucleotide-binding domain-containing protein n=1 Tax=Bacteroides rodentium TaxID=691816 RepID=UPI000471BCBD|nr:cyclic nucleotide-binding domain-containing protein [Bacteroides rodentium]